jgi:integrase
MDDALRAMSATEESLWESTAVQNLIRYRPSGTYFGRFRVGGKLVRQSLETAVFSVAKQRLPDKIREYRSRHESVKAFAGGKMTVGDAVEVYRGKVRANASLKPRSKDYREMTLDFMQRSWPSPFETDVRKVSERDCENWLIRFQQQYAPTVVNNSIGTLRAVFDEAIGTGARFNNPAAKLSRVRLRQKKLELPSREEFLKFVEQLRTAGARQSKDCADLVWFLAYSGLRIGEAKYVTWADADFPRRRLHVRGDPQTATKNGEMRYVPMIPELERMLTELRAERSNEPSSATVMRVLECQNSMTHAAAKIGMKRITTTTFVIYSRPFASKAASIFPLFRVTAVTTISLVLMAAPSISLNAQLPVLALPAPITFPKERKCHHEAGRPLCSWKIREPEIQSALMGGVRSVGARPVIR